ncbi:AAA family ATPase [Vibrio splendidus]|uniref:AAA family ATPase n=1 Tax=Vibrio splendidus TaxID=29497 RepID=UPI000808EDF4|nr:hypothetical protein [Vibrio splendidus]SBS62802.1 hypothetical protein VHE8714_01424 [Vibrio splendidus]
MKLKKIDIQAFRAYCQPGDGLFDFTNDNDDISNFITLYAPNGFGKTSFYDAIEWGFTNSVSRLSKDGKKLLSFAKSVEDDKFIIRNKYADDSINCKVDIHLSNQKLAITNILDHSKIRKGQKDVKFTEQEVIEENAFIKDVVLSQDGINAFLREDDAKLRYEKFIKKFGDINLSEQHNNLQKIYELSKKDERSIKNGIDELEGRIDSNVDLEFIDKINQQIESLGDDYKSFGKISYPYTEKTLFDYESKFLKGEQSIESEIKLVSTTIVNIESILSGTGKFTVSEYINNKNESLQLKSNSKLLDEKIILSKKLDYFDRYIDVTKAQLKFENERMGLLDSSILRYPEYQEIMVLLSNSKSEYKRLSTENDDLKVKISTHGQTLKINNVKRTEYLRMIEKKGSILERSEDIYSRLSCCNKEIDHHKSNITILERSVQESTEQLDRLMLNNKTATICLSLMEKKDYKPIEKFDLSDDLSEILHKIIDVSSKVEPLESKIENIKEKIVFEDKLDERIQILMTDAIKLIKEDKSTSCPVCSTNFSSTDSMIDIIINTRKSSYSNDKTRKSLHYYNSELLDHYSVLESKSYEFVSLMKSLSNKLEEQIYSNQNNIIRLNMEREQEQRNLSELSSEIEKINKEINFKSREQHESSLNETLDKLSNDVHHLEAVIRESEVEFNELLEQSEKLNASKSTIQAKVNALSDNSVLVEQQRAYDFLKVDYNVAKDRVESLLNKETLNVNITNDDLSSFVDEALSIKSELGDIQLDSLESDLVSIRTKITNLESINFHIESIISSELGIEVLPGTQHLIETLLLKSIGKRKEEVVFLTKKKNKLSNVREYLDNALPYLELVETNKKLDKLRQRYTFVTTVIQPKIYEEIEAVTSHIEKVIGSFFYEDLINELYRRVDPHPDYVKIKFVCKFNPREKPELHIVCTKSDEEKVIVPSLYFSSGQLNALSLCIFIAKALNVSDEKGNPIDFILIDDPVQAMDGLNILSTIDLLRGISLSHNKQIILSTHDESLFNLIKKKIPEDMFGSKFISLESHGKVACPSGRGSSLR